jgi:putative peptidoglycan lipid II flippase
MVLNIALIFPLRHAGLALATSLSAYLNAYLLWRGLRRGGVYRPHPGWARLLLQVGLASGVMALVLWLGALGQVAWFDVDGWRRALYLLGWIALGVGVYFAVLWLTGVRLATFLRAVREG